jgi:hypothetical protein
VSPCPGWCARPSRRLSAVARAARGAHGVFFERHLASRVALPPTRARAQLLFFGAGTTGGLTWATSTYILKMVTVPGKDAYLVTTPTLTGGTKDTEIAWKDVTRPMGYHPFSTFEAQGTKYYLDELGTMHDEAFPSKLEEALNK